MSPLNWNIDSYLFHEKKKKKRKKKISCGIKMPYFVATHSKSLPLHLKCKLTLDYCHDRPSDRLSYLTLSYYSSLQPILRKMVFTELPECGKVVWWYAWNSGITNDCVVCVSLSTVKRAGSRQFAAWNLSHHKHVTGMEMSCLATFGLDSDQTRPDHTAWHAWFSIKNGSSMDHNMRQVTHHKIFNVLHRFELIKLLHRKNCTRMCILQNYKIYSTQLFR